jgi:outer membrane protein OmpA-like peptidoglycan-associated protein
MKNLTTRRGLMLGFLSTLLMLTSSATHAQDVGGRIAFGFDAGGNKYYGNYTDSRFDFQGDAFIKWNIINWVSLIGEYNGGILGYKATTAGSIADQNNMFGANSQGSAGNNGTINHVRVGGWDLMGSLNVFPDQTFVPSVLAGIEALNFEPDDNTPAPLKSNAAGAYSKNVMGGVFGVGFEMFITPKVTFTGQGLIHLTGTDWIDGFSNPNNYRQDAFLTMGLGFSYYIFAPDAVDVPVQSNAGSATTNVTNNYTTDVYHSDTIYVQNPADTIYLASPKINTVFNFPGTLFIVNTDQFNNAESNNMNHLYQIKELVDQCPNLKVEIQGYASDEGTPDRNQKLSQMRADRIKEWLIAQGVSSDKIIRSVGFGTGNNAVRERTNVSASELETERAQNRRIAVRVVQTCN